MDVGQSFLIMSSIKEIKIMDLTKDTKIRFTEAVFSGRYPKAKFSHDRTIEGTILKESYGVKKGQHTFTIEVEKCSDNNYSVGEKIRRKGRNVYKKCTVLSYPETHKELADEKHRRAKIIKDRINMKKQHEKRNF